MFTIGDRVKVLSDDQFNGLSGVVISVTDEQWGSESGQDVLVRLTDNEGTEAHLRFTNLELTIDEHAIEQERVLRHYVSGRVARVERF